MCKSLGDADVPFIVLKGAALAHQVYPEPALRPMADLDLWIPADKLDRAHAALEAQGFCVPRALIDAQPVGAHLRHALSRVLTSPDGVTIELHGRVRSLDGLSWGFFRRAWDASLQASLGGVAARVLCPEHLLVHLCVHLGRSHRFDAGLLRLVDIALVVDYWRQRWNWADLLAEWRREHITTWMLLGLTLARDLLDAPVPADLQDAAPPQWTRMRALAEVRMWDARVLELPAALGEAIRREGRGRLAWLRWRFVDHYWRSDRPRTARAATGDAARRLWFDLRVRVPRYVRALRRGVLWGSGWTRALALERGRAELERLVAAAGDLGGVRDDQPPPDQPAIAGAPALG